MIWTGHVAPIGKMNTWKVLVGKPEGKRCNLEDLGVDGKITLEWILRT
jgi:hypothetical protein